MGVRNGLKSWLHACLKVRRAWRNKCSWKNAVTAWRFSVFRQAPYQDAGVGVLSAFWLVDRILVHRG